MVKVKLLYFIIGIVLFMIMVLGSFFAGRTYESLQEYRDLQPQKQMTGYDVWNSVNKYREEKGVARLKLSEELCDNIVGRWEEVEKNNNHDGFDEFVQRQKEANRYSQDLELTELFAPGLTGDQVVQNWKDSPSHDQFILNSEFTYGCSYAYNNLALLFLAEQAR